MDEITKLRFKLLDAKEKIHIKKENTAEWWQTLTLEEKLSCITIGTFVLVNFLGVIAVFLKRAKYESR